MPIDLVQIRESAEAKEDENYSFRQFLKTQCTLNPNELDQLVFETTRQVWSAVDCTACANCCRQTQPTFSEGEVSRIAGRLRMSRQQLIDAHLERAGPSDNNPW